MIYLTFQYISRFMYLFQDPQPGETSKMAMNRALMFDISFLLLCHIVQLYGIDVSSALVHYLAIQPFICSDCFPSLIFQLCSINVSLLLVHFLPSIHLSDLTSGLA